MDQRNRIGYITHAFEGEFLLEYWLQKYVKENSQKFGLTNTKWRKRSDPPCDLSATYKGKKHFIEVEWCPTSYIHHGHNKDQKFNQITVLMCLDQIKPTPEELTELPQTIIYIDTEDFSQWYHQTTGKHSKPQFTRNY